MAWVRLALPDDLSPAQRSLVEMHSVLNVLNVLEGELQLVGMLVEDPELLDPCLETARALRGRLSDPAAALAAARALPAVGAQVLATVARAREAGRVTQGANPLLDESVANLESILAVVDRRIVELEERAAHEASWVRRHPEAIVANLRQVMDAIALNSHGRYGVVYEASSQRERDYLVEIEIEPDPTGKVLIPAVFEDCLRDLLANARKYTEPGGHLRLHLRDDGEALELIVSDDGRGIPADEVETVAAFGATASNVAAHERFGGGFGLTKACWITARHGGSMWIDSRLGHGTRVRIRLPRPAGLRAGPRGTRTDRPGRDLPPQEGRSRARM